MLITKPCSRLLICIILGLHTSSSRATSASPSASTSLATLTSSSIDSRKTISSSPYNDHNATATPAPPSTRARRKRFVRFPALPPSYVLEGAPPPPLLPVVQQARSVRFAGPYPSWRQQKSYWRQHLGPGEYPSRPGAPVMGHRTPRLIFRDSDFGLGANNFFQSNQLPDIEEDYRDHRKQTFNEYPRLETEPRKEKRPLWKGDDSLCADGRSCEFFLMCWMSAGLLDGNCGGLMYACCHRPKDAAKASNDYSYLEQEPRDQIQSLGTDSYLAAETVTTQDVDEQCGISASKQTAQRRIVGGDEAGFGSFPWQELVKRGGGFEFLEKKSQKRIHEDSHADVIGSTKWCRKARNCHCNCGEIGAYGEIRFDVAVLRLDRPVHYMPHIAPICLPEKNEDFLGQYGWAAGWGALQAGSRLRPKTLQAVDVPVIDNRVCERWHRSNGINVVIYDEMMCAGYRGGGKDSCQVWKMKF
ncbi:coagulation factor IX [Copidosoma floridanum]|uniref:coagulation factor IX n=1 Tax=Copidosoma floridanum TaxID=29053 RepID=UPI000C6F777F|nr:coagulation factor IX [Copidosoma floridanum]